MIRIIITCFKKPTADLTRASDENASLSDTQRIIGGQEVNIKLVPHQTSLRYFNNHICGAAIISAQHCLTAAHCYEVGTYQNYYSILAGSTSVSGHEEQSAAHVSVQRFILHPRWNDDLNINDIAVLVLERPLPLNGQTIAVARLPLQNAPVPFGASGIVAGWLVNRQNACTSV